MLAGGTEVNASTRKSDFMGSGNPKGIQRKPQKAAPPKEYKVAGQQKTFFLWGYS